MEISVILDIFSGRPNPRWKLSQKDTSEFLNKVHNLKLTEDIHNELNKDELGYRGFIVEEKNFTEKLRYHVYNGIVNVVENQSSYALEDKEYTIEEWLLQTIPNDLDEIVKYVKQEIEKKMGKS